ncbi:hypothetical protein A6R68_16923 [Neotoma lepida]|uniref:Solute carrier family 41 member n=1 Tax=Neotoma lepida TaxID=56216 RepID=A0A1A6HG57_NEOLE|nr:hypothetical protein A6R68_16923 [Neotoma lepida]
MVPVIYQKSQEDRHKKANGIWQEGLSGAAQTFSKRSEPHLDYHEFSEQAFHGSSGHAPASCSPKYDDYAGYNYCDGREASETTAMLQDEDLSSEGDDVIVETNQKLPKESSGIMALQILVPFLLAGFGTVSAGMVLDIVQVNVGKMDSPIEKWNLIIGNLALKQSPPSLAILFCNCWLGWLPEMAKNLLILAAKTQCLFGFLPTDVTNRELGQIHYDTTDAHHIGGLILDTTVSDPNLVGIVVYTPVINALAFSTSSRQTPVTCVSLQQQQVDLQTPVTCVSLQQQQVDLQTPVTCVSLQQQQVDLQTPVTCVSLQQQQVDLQTPVTCVFTLLCIADWMVHRFWRKGKDPDSFSIPYLTALGDLLGTALLALSFHFLWLIGDRDGDLLVIPTDNLAKAFYQIMDCQ